VKIALQNISKTFGGFKAVDDVSFDEAGDGECFFLLGPSGCGKIKNQGRVSTKNE